MQELLYSLRTFAHLKDSDACADGQEPEDDCDNTDGRRLEALVEDL